MDKKRWVFFLLILVLAQAACNLSQTISTQFTPGPTPVVEITTFIMASATAPVSTDTPSATTSTPEPARISTSTPTNTPIPSPTLTETPTLANLFSSVDLSAQVISPICEPKTVRFEVTTADPKVYRVLLFIRLHYKTAGDRTGWNNGFAMKPFGGKFTYDLQASSISDFNKFMDPVAWVQFQLVALDQSGAIIGRSEVFPEKLTITATCS